MMSSLLLVCRWCHVLKVPVHAAHFECDSWRWTECPSPPAADPNPNLDREHVCWAVVVWCRMTSATWCWTVCLMSDNRSCCRTSTSWSARVNLRHPPPPNLHVAGRRNENKWWLCVRAKHVANYCIAHLWYLRHQLISAVDIWLSVLLGRVGRSETNLSSLTVDHVYVCISVGDVYFCLQQVSFTCVQWTSNSCCNANEEDLWSFKWLIRWRYDTRCCYNVCSKADMSQLNRPHGKSYTCRHQCSRIHRMTVT